MIRFLSKILILLFGLTACASSSSPRINTQLPWRNFEEVKSTLNKIELGKTTFEDLKKLGFDPVKIPNTLKFYNVKGVLLPDPTSVVDELTEGARTCYKNSSFCEGYLFMVRVQDSIRSRKGIFSTEVKVNVWGFDIEVYLIPKKNTKEMVVIYIRVSLQNYWFKTKYLPNDYYWSRWSPTLPSPKPLNAK